MTKTTMFKQFGFTQFTAAAISGISCRALTSFWHTGGKAQEQIRLNGNKYNVLLSFEKTSKLFLCSLKFQGRKLFGLSDVIWLAYHTCNVKVRVQIPLGPLIRGLTSVGRRTD